MHELFSPQSYMLLAHYMCGDRYGLLRLNVALNSADAYIQHAAISMLGYWPAYGQAEVLLSGWLLQLVVGKLRKGEVGWAALNTLAAIGRWRGGPVAVQALLELDGLVTDLCGLLHPTRHQLAAARLLARLLDDAAWRGYFDSKKVELRSALLVALKTPNNLRCSIWAASALVSLGEDSGVVCEHISITQQHVH